MDITVPLLADCKPENVELLARRLGVPIPTVRDEYTRAAILNRHVAEAIEADRRQAEAEERRRMDKAAMMKVASEIADMLGEKAPRPRRQIARIVGLMGEDWTRSHAQAATTIGERADSDELRAVVFAGDKPRTLGGVFFAWARKVAAKEGVPRREFFRCFYDTPPQVKAAPARPAPKPKPERKPERPAKPTSPRRKAPVVPEVYQVRRRA